jgi:hypothetical protein
VVKDMDTLSMWSMVQLLTLAYREKLVRRAELLIVCAHYPTNFSKLVIVKRRWILRIYNMVIIYIYEKLVTFQY